MTWRDLWKVAGPILDEKENIREGHVLIEQVGEVGIPNGFSVYAQRYFSRFLDEFKDQPGLRFCQVGAFAGHATEWLIYNILTHHSSHLFDVDPWEGTTDLFYDIERNTGIHGMSLDYVYQQYHHTVALLGSRQSQLKTRRMTSDQFFDLMPPDRPYFDFIYIDGDHRPFQVLKDALNAYPRLKIGGIMAFDDYEFEFKDEKGKTVSAHNSIDAFLEAADDRLELLVKDVQVWVRRVR